MIDTSRHVPIFDAIQFAREGGGVEIVGCGATGSRVALELVKLGVRRLRLWDDDRVEEHNIANQAFEAQDAGQYKVNALARLIARQAEDVEVSARVERVRESGSQILQWPVLFLLTDSMSSRKQIGEGLKRNMKVQQLVETRLGTNIGYVYGLDARIPSHHKQWMDTLSEDAVVETSACGARITIGASAAMLSGMAVWFFMNWAARRQGKEIKTETVNELVFCMQPWMMQTRRWV